MAVASGCGKSGLTKGSAHAFDATAREASDPGIPAADSKLPVYQLQIGARELASLERGVYSNDTYPATFTFDGKSQAVRIRCRGAWARSWPKKSLKIFFEKRERFQGLHCLNLNSGWRDPAFFREALAYHVYAACGAVAPKARAVRLDINGRFYGLYLEIEQPAKSFLARNHLKGASVYKASSRSNAADERDLGDARLFAAHYEKETGKDGDNGDLRQFCHDLAGASNTSEFFNHRVDLDKYINYLAATVLVQHWDGFNKNHFIIHDVRGTDKWFPVPWDLDRTFGDHWNWSFNQTRLPVLLGTQRAPGVTGWNRMEDRFFSDPALRNRFLDRLEELLRNEFTEEKLFPVVDTLESKIGAEGELDCRHWPRQFGDLQDGIRQVKRFIGERRAFLLAELPKLRQRQ